MIERLRRALEHVDELPPEAQEELAEQIEEYTHLADGRVPAGRSFAGIWRDLPDDMEETLLRWRRESGRLAALREQIVATGMPLLSWDEVEAEVAERRGERTE